MSWFRLHRVEIEALAGLKTPTLDWNKVNERVKKR